jgi:hypothetical protein
VSPNYEIIVLKPLRDVVFGTNDRPVWCFIFLVANDRRRTEYRGVRSGDNVGEVVASFTIFAASMVCDSNAGVGVRAVMKSFGGVG